MGWLVFALLAGAILALLAWRGGIRSAPLIAAALALATAGYAWQGRPRLAGSPTAPRATHPAGDPIFAEERGIWLENVGPEAQLLDAADNLIRAGQPDYAVGILRGAVRRAPDSMTLWIGLANALVTYADGSVTPPARYAFVRAAQIAPMHPAPAYFLGMAYAQEGDLDAAERIWRGLLVAAPEDAPWRALVEQRLGVVARLRSGAPIAP